VITLLGLLAAGHGEHDVRHTTRPGIAGPLGHRTPDDLSLAGHGLGCVERPRSTGRLHEAREQ